MRIDQARKLSASVLIVFALTFLFPLSALSQLPSVAAPKFSKAVAFDVSPPLRSLPMAPPLRGFSSEP